jgi:hypothetical protein
MDVDEDVVELEYKELLAEALGEVESPGTFASGGQLQSAPSIELTIEGVGDIHVPLKKYRIPILVAACKQAPFGKGADTGARAFLSAKRTMRCSCCKLLLAIPIDQLLMCMFSFFMT